tara:strand:- start:2289 stop:2396 length:108 start_codon:yes stop_codon:yes gene_type:complete
MSMKKEEEGSNSEASEGLVDFDEEALFDGLSSTSD